MVPIRDSGFIEAFHDYMAAQGGKAEKKERTGSMDWWTETPAILAFYFIRLAAANSFVTFCVPIRHLRGCDAIKAF
jgi:hypothetical protein